LNVFVVFVDCNIVVVEGIIGFVVREISVAQPVRRGFKEIKQGHGALVCV